MSDRAREPQILPEPGSGKQDDGKSIWLHGLWLVVMLILFEVSKVVLFVAALVQFGWRVFNQEENQPIADFGAELAAWQGATTRFLTGASNARPFPFAKWGEVEEDRQD